MWPEYLMAHVRPWNPEVLALGVTRYFAKVLGDRNDKRNIFLKKNGAGKIVYTQLKVKTRYTSLTW